MDSIDLGLWLGMVFAVNQNMTGFDLLDITLVVLLIVLVISSILTVAVLIITSFYLARTRRRLKRLEASPFYLRDLNGRPLRERK